MKNYAKRLALLAGLLLAFLGVPVFAQSVSAPAPQSVTGTNALEDSQAAEDESPDVMVRGKTGIESIDTLAVYEWDVETEHKSLPLTLALSVLPGGGHFYSGHYVRGGFILALELGLTYEVFFNKAYQQDRRFKQAKPYRDSVAFYTKAMMGAPRDSLPRLRTERARYANLVRGFNDKKMEEEDLRKAELAWLIGLHVYNMFDAYGIWVNNQGHNMDTHPITTALMWAIIPGGGQIYNRDYGKAGLVYMGLIGALASAIGTQHIVNYYLDRKHVMEAEENADEIERLQERVTHYRKNRNQYIWGTALIYLYSIGDAVVDALLNDFDNPVHFAVAPTYEGGVFAGLGFDF